MLAACSSGKKRLEQGDYDTAVYKSVKRLQQKPNYSKAEKVLRQAYTLAVSEHMNVIEFHDKTDNPFKYDKMVREYELISYLNRAIRRYPLYSDLVSLVDVKDELVLTRGEAAFAHKREGIKLLDLGNKQRARDAYHHFVQANKFAAGTVVVKELDAAQEAGTVNVVLEFANSDRFFRSFNTDLVFSNVMSSFKNTRYRFMRVVEPGEIDFVADEIIQIEMDEAHVGGVDFSRNIFEVEKDDVYMGEAETDSGEVVKVYGTVTADYIEYCKTINSRARIMVQRIDGHTSAVIQRQVFPSSYNWTEKWATYRGDKRALSKGQLDFARRSEPNPPNPQWMFAQTVKPLAGRSIDFLRGQYSYLR
ncbi:MAG: hypothetical protein COA58_00040 [Bacteroidetes bacterium]|nr:MAG: hypothetical protein COA58_00040 [Bacteroidota bacterium]